MMKLSPCSNASKCSKIVGCFSRGSICVTSNTAVFIMIILFIVKHLLISDIFILYLFTTLLFDIALSFHMRFALICQMEPLMVKDLAVQKTAERTIREWLPIAIIPRP